MDALTYWTEWIARLAACHRQLRRQLAKVAETENLNDTQLLVLCCCRANQAQQPSQQQLAAQVGLSTSQASGVFESLRSKGLIVISHRQGDRRRHGWQVTELGEQCVMRIAERLQSLIAKWQSSLHAQDELIVIEILQRFTNMDWRPGAPSQHDVQEAA